MSESRRSGTWPRRAARAGALLVGLCAVLAVAAAGAQAGGWATTTVDRAPTGPVAGREWYVTFTVRQHGVRPVDVDGVAIELTAADGSSRRVPAAHLGERGRYGASILFPVDGTWRWKAIQGPFPAHELGTVEVAAGSAPAGAVGEPAADRGAAWPLVLVGVGGAVVLLTLLVVGGRTRPGALGRG